MKSTRKYLTLFLALVLSITRILGDHIVYEAATAPTNIRIEVNEAAGIPSQINGWFVEAGTTDRYEFYLPGGVNLNNIFVSWDGDATVTVDGTTYSSGTLPVPALNTSDTYTFKNGNTTLVSYRLVTYQGSYNENVQRVFIEIDESEGHNTIAQMDGDSEHKTECTGRININGTWYELSKMKGRGNATWENARDKKPYNVTVGSKINFPGVDSEPTKKWSFMAEILDRSLLGNRAGFYLAEQLGIGQSTTHADVWMNGEYQGCYMVTPKTDSFVTKSGYMIEQDNYKEDPVSQGGDPQFTLNGLKEYNGTWSSVYNRITVKSVGSTLTNLYPNSDYPEDDVAQNVIKPWLQRALDAILSSNGYNSENRYYTDYIDIVSFARMYLMHEYIKSYDVCAGSILYHRDGSTDDDKLIAGPLWDLDNAMGSVYNNNLLGQGSDRRSAQGYFIPIITEYKTSIYKNLGNHSDFMEEVKKQYTRNKTYFDNLSDDFDQMAQDIRQSADMNFKKVIDIGNQQGKNNHYYSKDTPLGSGIYAQNYKKTTTWSDYVDNMRTYISVRSLWFADHYYDENYVCTHNYEDVITPPTCITEGYTTHTCTICGDSYVDTPTALIPHDYENDECTMCHQQLIYVNIECDAGSSVTVFETQDTTGACIENAEVVHPRASKTGWIECNGDGQVNFQVIVDPGFVFEEVSATPTESYNKFNSYDNLVYRLTKVNSDLTITVKAYTHITFDANNGEGNMEPQQIYGNVETTLAKNAFTREHYSFAGWNTKADGTGTAYSDEMAVTLSGPVTLYAQWEIDKFDIIFRNEDGTVLQNTKTAYGNMPVYSGETPVKESDVQYNYVFTGWNPAITAVTGNATYTAVYDSILREYKITFVNYDGTVLQTGDVAYGTTPAYTGATPTKPADKDYYYTFSTWTPTIVSTAGEATYTTTYTSSERTYGMPLWSWIGSDADGYTSATATFTTDDGHEEFTQTVNSVPLSATVDPDCVTDGKTTYTASITFRGNQYSNVKEVTITKLGHDYAATVTEPTCTERGYTTHTCTRCNDSYIDTYVDELGHSWGQWQVTVAPTCTEKGTHERECSRCHLKQQAEIAALGHTEGEAVVENTINPTCTKDGSYDSVVYCTVCDAELSREKVTVPAAGHTPGESHHENEEGSSCTEPGSYDEVVRCTVCNEIISSQHMIVDALGHDWGQWHQTKAPTCTEKGTDTRECTRCDARETRDVDPHGHTPAAAVKENNVEPNCTEDGGYDMVIYCSVCGHELSRVHEVVPATGHTPGEKHNENEVPATCTEDGTYDEVVRCTVCDAVISSEPKTSPALGHEWGQWHQTKAPTCTEDGVESRECTRCDATESRNVDSLGHTHGEAVKENEVSPTCTKEGSYDSVVYCTVCKAEISREHKVVPATGHTPGEAHNEDEVPASCTEQGTYNEVIRCTVCNEIISSVPKTTDPLGHNFSEWHQIKAPTCTKNGIESRECTRCDATESRNVDPLGHTPGEAVKENEVSPTCIKEGSYDSVVYCTVCHAELSREKVIIPATGHTSGEPVHEHEVTPTCTTEGSYDEVIYCTVCNEELSRKTVRIDPLGHTPGEAFRENNVDPTCETEGSYDEVIYCTVCHEKLSTEHKTVEATGHTPGEPKHENEIKATCTSEGSYDVVIRCAICNKILSTEKKTEKALGHSYGEWKYDGEEAKTHTRLCSNDPSHKETENCQFDDGIVTGNVTTYTCTICGGTYIVKEGGPEVPSEIKISRIAGDNRFATSQDIATIIKENSGTEKLNAVILASGDNFADALAGSYLSAVKNAPIILTRAGKETEVNKYISSILKPNGTVYVLGGTAAVPESCLNGLTDKDYVIKRLAGDNRYLTDLAILKEAGMESDSVLVSLGDNFADSLSASASGLPILLVKDKLTDGQKKFLRNYIDKKIYILGGTNAVSKTIESEMSRYGTVVRIEGANRYETSTRIAEEFYSDTDTIVMAVGDNFPDGLCGGALAYQLNAPVVLIKEGRTEYARKIVTENEITEGIILGGTNAVKDAVANEVFGRDADAAISAFE